MKPLEKTESSCVMLMANLVTPISIEAVIKEDDVLDKEVSYDNYGITAGYEFDSHVSLLYAKKYLEYDNIKEGIEYLNKDKNLGFFNILRKGCESEDKLLPLLNHFSLDYFDNEDNDTLVLNLKKTSRWYKPLVILNDGLSKMFKVYSDYDKYNPHMTLAYLKKGMIDKYLRDDRLKLLLQDSKFFFEDIVVSYDYRQFNITNNKSVDRFFRVSELVKDYKEFKKDTNM